MKQVLVVKDVGELNCSHNQVAALPMHSAEKIYLNVHSH